MNSFKPEVDTGEGRWSDNALRFETETEARAWADDLYRRWVLVKATRATPTADRPTHCFKDGKLTSYEPARTL